MVRPDVLAILETEIWPNLLAGAHCSGVRTAIINGRISDRSFHKYDHIKPLMRFALSHVDAFSMISDLDARRVHALGAPAERIAVHGSAKFDVSDPSDADRERHWAQHLFSVDADIPVFVAGSTRDPEEDAVLDAYIRIRNHDSRAILIIAPRHIQRCDQIVAKVAAKGLACQRRSQIDGDNQRRRAPVVVVDTIGELFAIYSIARFVFCGGSLVPKGGQNLLEPALWGKPIMYGPSMEDFARAKELIESVGGGVRVQNGDQIAHTVVQWLQDPEKARKAGQAARNAVLPHRGAARKHARVLLDLLNKSAS
jgi:3-deoxy-D-manno-octulosonic-acid transferase